MIIAAKYSGICQSCGQSIQVGEKIEWQRGQKPRHTTCLSSDSAQITVQNFDWAAEPGYVFQEREGSPWLTVVSSRGWWCDEPLAFGKLDGVDGYIYDWTCRPATAEEIGKAEAEQKERKEKEQKERTEKVAKAKAERELYKSKLNALAAERDQVIAEHGLQPIHDVPTIEGTVEEKAVTPPGKGFSWTIFYKVTRDAQGNVLLVSWWNEEAGGSYWGTPALAKQGNRAQRIGQWWREKGYGADCYPGPGVPREELDAEELAEVERLETAKYQACVESQVKGLYSLRPFLRRPGKESVMITPLTSTIEGNQLILTISKEYEDLFRADLVRRMGLLERDFGGWAETYNDPKRGIYKTHAPLEFVIRVVA